MSTRGSDGLLTRLLVAALSTEKSRERVSVVVKAIEDAQVEALKEVSQLRGVSGWMGERGVYNRGLRGPHASATRDALVQSADDLAASYRETVASAGKFS